MLETYFYDGAHIHTLLLLVTSLISLHTLILYIPMPFSIEFPLMTKGGVRLDVLLNATTRRDEQGNVIGVVGTCLLFFVRVLVEVSLFECILVQCVLLEQGIRIV